MNKQETFDYVVKHLYTQGKPAMDSKERCSYRTEEGLMCAVGCLIPEDMYDEGMEGKSVKSLEINGFKLPDVIVEHKEMMVDLQNVHDDWAESQPFSSIVPALKKVALINDLMYNKPY